MKEGCTKTSRSVQTQALTNPQLTLFCQVRDVGRVFYGLLLTLTVGKCTLFCSQFKTLHSCQHYGISLSIFNNTSTISTWNLKWSLYLSLPVFYVMIMFAAGTKRGFMQGLCSTYLETLEWLKRFGNLAGNVTSGLWC